MFSDPLRVICTGCLKLDFIHRADRRTRLVAISRISLRINIQCHQVDRIIRSNAQGGFNWNTYINRLRFSRKPLLRLFLFPCLKNRRVYISYMDNIIHFWYTTLAVYFIPPSQIRRHTKWACSAQMIFQFQIYWVEQLIICNFDAAHLHITDLFSNGLQKLVVRGD